MTRRIRSQTVLALLVAGAIGILIVVALSATPASAAPALNPCGCREGAPGTCICEKKSRCGCPGECEPKGCEEKRAKQLEKEIQAETRKAEEAQRRQHARQEKETPDDSSGRGSTGNSAAERPAPAPEMPKKPKIVKMTAAQKRDLAKLISAYLAEHPEQTGKAIGEVQSEMRR